jgi:hypothetical protein
MGVTDEAGFCYSELSAFSFQPSAISLQPSAISFQQYRKNGLKAEG